MSTVTEQQDCYFARPPEMLVLEGYRRWMAGFDTGSVAPWELTHSLYAELLGPEEGRHALAELAHFVRTLRRCAACPLKSYPFNAHHVCRDECLTLGLIASLQHGNAEAAQTCLGAMACPLLACEIAQAARSFAETLARLDHKLLPIPRDAIDDILNRASRKTVH